MTSKLNEISNFNLTLAPMVGLSHVAMRKSLRNFIPEEVRPIWPTEMLNSRKLPYQPVGHTPETIREENEILCPQILGNTEKYIARSIQRLESWGAKAIDINMGCPVKKALRHNYGVSLMGDIDYAKEVVSMAVRNSNIPVSVKLRAGHQKDNIFLLKFCEELIKAGASWLCLHPRLASEKRKGKADWSQIKLLKDEFDVPIIGNGDIQTVEDIRNMISQTGCDQVMIGRALTAKPWLLTKWAKEQGFDTTNFDHLIPEDGYEEAKVYGIYLNDFFNNCFEFFDEKNALKRIKFFTKVSTPWLNFGHSLSKGLFKLKEQKEISDFTQSFFENDSLKMSTRTELRY